MFSISRKLPGSPVLETNEAPSMIHVLSYPWFQNGDLSAGALLSERERCRMSSVPSSVRVGGVVTVSYTHLDVYKRQVFTQ